MSLLVNKNGYTFQVDHDGKLIVDSMITSDGLEEAIKVIALIKKLDSLGYELPKALLDSVREYDEAVK